jgi:hypothetical protein
MVAFTDRQKREILAHLEGREKPEWLWNIRRVAAGWSVRYLAAGRWRTKTFHDPVVRTKRVPLLYSLYQALRFRSESGTPDASVRPGRCERPQSEQLAHSPGGPRYTVAPLSGTPPRKQWDSFLAKHGSMLKEMRRIRLPGELGSKARLEWVAILRDGSRCCMDGSRV